MTDIRKSDIDGPITSTIARSTFRFPCNAPAPLVVNGGTYAGCQLDKGHEGDQHEFLVRWKR